MTISNGTLEGDNTGIEMRSGTLNISGGKISGGMGTPSSRANDNGSTTFNAAVAVAQHTTKHPITVNITGGTLTGGAAFYESDPNGIYDADSSVQKPVVSITGGSFGGQLYSADCQNFISGGFFTENPDEYAAADKAAVASGRSDVSITGGSFGGQLYSADCQNFISGGFFTENPDEYAAADKAAVASGRSDYPWTVAEATESIVEPAVGEPKIDIPNTIAPADRDAVEAAAKEINVQGLAAYASTAAQQSNVDEAVAEKALKDENIAGNETYVYAQAYLQITPKSYTAPKPDGSTPASLTMDITPMFRLVASTTDDPTAITVKTDEGVTNANAVVIPNTKPKKLDVKGTVHMIVPMPSGFIKEPAPQNIFVQHKSYEYTAAIRKTAQDQFVAEFDNPHGFSAFTFTLNATSEAMLNHIGYASLEKAIADAKNNETVIVMKDGLSASMSGDSRTITVQNGTDSPITVSVNGKDYTLEKKGNKDDSVEITYTHPSSSGGGSSTTSYAVTVDKAANGTVSASAKYASKGRTVTLTVSPDKGCELDDLTVTDKNGKEVKLTDKGSGKFTFEMPASKVTVKAVFVKNDGKPEQVCGFEDVKTNDWFSEEVEYVVDKGMMNGISDTRFAPNATTTRGMIVTILYRLEGSPNLDNENLGYPYADVNANAYYGDAVYWARLNGIVNGYTTEKFGPSDAITREQMAAILYRYAQYKGYDVSKTTKLDEYKDGAEVSAYATAAMQWANAEGLITGKTSITLVPKGSATRAEVATILMRFCENIVK